MLVLKEHISEKMDEETQDVRIRVCGVDVCFTVNNQADTGTFRAAPPPRSMPAPRAALGGYCPIRGNSIAAPRCSVRASHASSAASHGSHAAAIACHSSGHGARSTSAGEVRLARRAGQ